MKNIDVRTHLKQYFIRYPDIPSCNVTFSINGLVERPLEGTTVDEVYEWLTEDIKYFIRTRTAL